MSEEPIVKPISSPKRDFKQLGQNSQAVVGELREFLSSLKGKSPKEMMGAVAGVPGGAAGLLGAPSG